MKKIEVTSIELDGVTICVLDGYASPPYILVVMGFKGRMVEFITVEIDDNEKMNIVSKKGCCDAEVFLKYELVRWAENRNYIHASMSPEL